MPIILDKIDKRILFEMQKNTRIPVTKLAKIVGRSKESVRYRIKQLKEKGVIAGFTIWMDYSKLGYLSAKIYLNLANKPQRIKEFVEYVTKDKRLFWMGIADGAWSAGLTYFVNSNREFFEMKNELFSKFKDIILESNTGMLVDVNVCDYTFLYDAETNWKTIVGSIGDYKMDELEKHILKELYLDSTISVVELARKYNTTVDIIRGRIKKLEENKIISRYVTKIDFSKLGYEFYKTFLYFTDLTKSDEQRLMEYTRNHPKIIHLMRQISPWDIELEILCENYHEYNKLIADLTQEFSDVINKVETAIMSADYVFPSNKLIFE